MKKLNPILENRAVEIYATTPNVPHKDVAIELGISDKTLMKLRKDSNFWQKVYDTYMISFEGEIVDVVRAMIREARAGNVQAGRLVMEHSGKLQKHLNVTITSPFEKWMQSQENKQLGTSEQISPNGNWIQDAEIIDVPEDVQESFGELDKELQQKKAYLDRRRELHGWCKRAEAVGIAPLPPRRPTKGQRLDWEMSIVRAEEEQLNSNAES